MEGKYISIKVIVDRLMRNPLMADIELEAAIDYAIQFMELAGVVANKIAVAAR